MMFRNNLKIAYRNIIRNKVYSFINISGLAIGIASALLIMLWVEDEISFDQFNENNNKIYRLVSDWKKWDWNGFPGTPEPLGPAIKSSLPEIDNFFRIAEFDRAVFKYNDKVFYEKRGVIVDHSLFSIFSFRFKSGNPKAAFNNPDGLVISESLARKYFGNKEPLGKFIKVNDKLKMVSGVFYDMPSNSHLQFDFALPFKFISKFANIATGWNAFNFTTYVLLNPDNYRNLTKVSEKMTNIGKSNECPQVKSGVIFRLQPLSEVHLDGSGGETNYLVIGSKSNVYIFSIIAIFIFLIACINYMNLSTIKSMNRAKEVGIRKTLGAKKKQLIWQFLGESILMSFIAIIFSVIIAKLTLPLFNDLIGKNLSIDFISLKFFCKLISIILFTGLIAGSYPALYLSSFNTIKILKKELQIRTSAVSFRKILVIFQFSLSIALIFVTIIVYQQINYSKEMKLGYNKENLIYIPIVENLKNKCEVMKNKLLSNPLIKGVSAHSYNFLTSAQRAAGFRWEEMDESRKKSLDLIFSGIDYNFLMMMNIKLVEGRYFLKEDSIKKDGVFMNEAAVKDMNLKSPVGKWISLGKWKKTIIGVVKDIHFRSSRTNVEPRIYYLKDYSKNASGIILIRINGTKTSEAISLIKKEWNKINASSPFEYAFINDSYRNLYKAEIQIGTIFNSFSILAIFISCLGLFGLSKFSAEQRKKEIGIRKVLGASITGIIQNISKEFLILIIIANIIALPVALYAMKKWLQNFAYHVDLTIWPFLLSGILALLIALLTVSWQAIKAATANPVDSLRCE